MRHVRAVFLVALGAAFVVALSAEADPPLVNAFSASVTCPPFNLYNPDAGSGVNGLLACSDGYRAVRAETESASAIYYCGKTGCTVANYATYGMKRCTTCNGGPIFSADVNVGQVRCISGTADAGVAIAIMCGK